MCTSESSLSSSQVVWTARLRTERTRGPLDLLLALVCKRWVGPAGEAPRGVPRGVAMPNEDELARGLGVRPAGQSERPPAAQQQ
eukprot:scaffold60391_cov35-Tisochrysis_lutea.AAC.4